MKRLFIFILSAAAFVSCSTDPTEEKTGDNQVRHTLGGNADSLHNLGYDTTTNTKDTTIK